MQERRWLEGVEALSRLQCSLINAIMQKREHQIALIWSAHDTDHVMTRQFVIKIGPQMMRLRHKVVHYERWKEAYTYAKQLEYVIGSCPHHFPETRG
jgi:hypothetical protein